MRLLQISVPEGEREAILDVVRGHELGYRITEQIGDRGGDVLVHVLVPADAVEHVLDDLQAAGYDRGTYTVSMDTELATFQGIDEVQNKWAKTPNRIAPETLRSKAKGMRSNTRSYVWMMVLSAIVAVAGLMIGSPAVVVGSMVIAPIVSPMMTASVGAVRDDRVMFVDSIHMQALGLAVAIVAATAFAWLIQQLSVVPVELSIRQMELMSLRLSPSILAIAVGLTAGAAGAYGLATTGRVTIVGVMIAAALIPTAAAVGIGLAWGDLVVALGALLLLVLNLVAVNIGATSMLLYLSYRPDEVDDPIFGFETPRQTTVVLGTVLAILVVVTVTGFAFYEQSSFERSVNQAVTDVLDDQQYEALGISSITVEYTAEPVSETTTVTVVVTRTDDGSYDDLPERLADGITDRTDQDVLVQVQYVDLDRSEDPGSTSRS